jgi:hypothetical protein
VIRGTLLALVEAMQPDGVLCAGRIQLAGAAGLPPRTLNRHLAQAVAAGWLTHERRGQKHLVPVYRATIPQQATDGPLSTGLSGPSTRVLSTGLSGPPGGLLHIESASVSEHVALDESHDRRGEQNGSRATSPQRVKELRSDGEQQMPWREPPGWRCRLCSHLLPPNYRDAGLELCPPCEAVVA